MAHVVQVANPGTRVVYAVVFALFPMSTLGGIVDPTPGPDDPEL